MFVCVDIFLHVNGSFLYTIVHGHLCKTVALLLIICAFPGTDGTLPFSLSDLAHTPLPVNLEVLLYPQCSSFGWAPLFYFYLLLPILPVCGKYTL